MTNYAILLVGLALAGDGRPAAESRVYPVADLLIPVNGERLDSFVRLFQRLERDQVPFPETDAERHRQYLRGLLQNVEKDHVPFPESDLVLPSSSTALDPVLGYYAPSKRLVEKRHCKRE